MLKKTFQILILFIAAISCLTCQKTGISRINKVAMDSVHISGTSVTAYGKIVDISDYGISEYDFCYGNYPDPGPYLDAEFSNPTETGQFSAVLDKIYFGETIYIRAYAEDYEGEIVYSNTLTFSIGNLNGITVVTDPATILSTSGVSVNGTVSGVGSLTLIDFGHCWSTSPNPTINDAKTSFGALQNDSTFKSDITGLQLSVTYYVRAYAVANDNTVVYGNEQSFTIPDLAVQTDTFSFPNSTDVTMIGTITSLGVNPVTNHGFCWSYTTSQPDMNNNVISLGATGNTGQFAGGLNNILPGVTYYFRAFATDGIYVRYGGVKKFIK